MFADVHFLMFAQNWNNYNAHVTSMLCRQKIVLKDVKSLTFIILLNCERLILMGSATNAT
jgi:hypothetical protein